jgi:hypothetical protein
MSSASIVLFSCSIAKRTRSFPSSYIYRTSRPDLLRNILPNFRTTQSLL